MVGDVAPPDPFPLQDLQPGPRADPVPEAFVEDFANAGGDGAGIAHLDPDFVVDGESLEQALG
eukprot:14696197-Alexandrium_andersonii.AAC.1